MELSRDDREALERLEEELWREETRFDLAYMDRVLAADFFEFGRSGRMYRREDTLAISRAPIDAAFPLAELQTRLLAPDVAQVAYNSAVRYDGVVQWARRRSIWSRPPRGWVSRFHQGAPFAKDAV
jgi:hypothetical protein